MSDLKEIIRNTNLKIRSKLSKDYQLKASEQICNKIRSLNEYRYAKKIAFYYAKDNEIDLSELWKSAPLHGKQCFFPKIIPDNMLAFLPSTPKTKFIKNQFQIPEPDIELNYAINPDTLDLIFLPLVAFDIYCNRIGMGAGFYDKSLADCSHPLLVGVAYEFQRSTYIESQSWDMPLSVIITEKDLYWSKE